MEIIRRMKKKEGVQVRRDGTKNLTTSDKKQGNQVNYTYIVRCSDGTLYTGWTNHLEQRVKAHNDGRGAKYTRSRRPVALVYREIFATKEEAMSREAAIKKMTRKQKEILLQSDGRNCAESEG